MSDIAKVMVFWCSVVSCCSFVNLRPVEQSNESLSLGVAKYVALALIASGVVGYTIPEIMLNLKRRADARTVSTEVTPESENRRALMRLQKTAQWLFASGLLLGGGVLAKKAYDSTRQGKKEYEAVLQKRLQDQLAKEKANREKLAAEAKIKAEEERRIAEEMKDLNEDRFVQLAMDERFKIIVRLISNYEKEADLEGKKRIKERLETFMVAVSPLPDSSLGDGGQIVKNSVGRKMIAIHPDKFTGDSLKSLISQIFDWTKAGGHRSNKSLPTAQMLQLREKILKHDAKPLVDEGNAGDEPDRNSVKDSVQLSRELLIGIDEELAKGCTAERRDQLLCIKEVLEKSFAEKKAQAVLEEKLFESVGNFATSKEKQIAFAKLKQAILACSTLSHVSYKEHIDGLKGKNILKGKLPDHLTKYSRSLSQSELDEVI